MEVRGASQVRATKQSNAKIVEFLGKKLLGASDIRVIKGGETDCLVAFRYKLYSQSNGGLLQSLSEVVYCIYHPGVAVQRAEINQGDALIEVTCNRATLGL